MTFSSTLPSGSNSELWYHICPSSSEKLTCILLGTISCFQLYFLSLLLKFACCSVIYIVLCFTLSCIFLFRSRTIHDISASEEDAEDSQAITIPQFDGGSDDKPG